MTDHFTRYAQAYITPNQKASTVAKTLWDKFFVHYGFPEKILSDQGCNFESKLLKELCILAQIKKMHTTPYRPEGNGWCERFNRTLISMLGTLPEEFKSEWVNHVNMLTYAYNCMRSNATGFSPYYLLYGWRPLLPIDIEFGVMTPDLTEVVTLKYVHRLQKRLDYAFKKAADFSRKEAQRSKKRYDKTAKTSKLEPGDLVLVWRKGFQEKHKISDRWESDPYEVIKQREDGLPVFVVVNNGRERVLHRNMLFPLNYRHEIESNIDNLGKSDRMAPEQIQGDAEMSDLEDQPVYQGPQTRSHTKALMKANLIMNKCFETDNAFEPSHEKETLSSLVNQFLFLQAACIYNFICDVIETGAHLSSY